MHISEYMRSAKLKPAISLSTSHNYGLLPGTGEVAFGSWSFRNNEGVAKTRQDGHCSVLSAGAADVSGDVGELTGVLK